MFGTGQTAAHGSSHFGRRVNQEIMEDNIALVTANQENAQASQSGTIGNAILNKSLCAARSSAQVIYPVYVDVFLKQIFPGSTTRYPTILPTDIGINVNF